MAKQPLVALTIGSGYREICSILRATGAQVLTIHAFSERKLVRLATHLLLPGGADIHPQHYKQPVTYARGFDEERDWIELRLARYAIHSGLPTLGICRGLQVLAVAAGGTLFQDFATQRSLPPHAARGHEITTAPNSRLRSWLGARWHVNTYHHQAIAKLPADWTATAWSTPDHIVEGIEHNHKPLLGVQFHPEYVADAADRAGEALIATWLNAPTGRAGAHAHHPIYLKQSQLEC